MGSSTLSLWLDQVLVGALTAEKSHDDEHPAASNPKYIEAAMQYPNDAAYATEILRFTPTVLVPFVSHLHTLNECGS